MHGMAVNSSSHIPPFIPQTGNPHSIKMTERVMSKNTLSSRIIQPKPLDLFPVCSGSNAKRRAKMGTALQNIRLRFPRFSSPRRFFRRLERMSHTIPFSLAVRTDIFPFSWDI